MNGYQYDYAFAQLQGQNIKFVKYLVYVEIVLPRDPQQAVLSLKPVQNVIHSSQVSRNSLIQPVELNGLIRNTVLKNRKCLLLLSKLFHFPHIPLLTLYFLSFY